MDTSSSVKHPSSPIGIVVAAALLYVGAVGLMLLGVALYPGVEQWHTALAFLLAASAIFGVTAALLLPRLHRVRDATAAAQSLAAMHFDVRMQPADDEFTALASALNAAGSSIGTLIGRLRRERAQLEALLNASSDSTVAIDGAGQVVYVNDAARAMFARSSDPLAKPFIEVVRDHDLSEQLLAAARAGERSVRVVAYGPSQRWLQATAVPIEGAGDWAALAVFHDLTEVRRLDSVRRDFISNVSHELRTPLAGIRAAAETMQEGALDDRPAAVEFLSHIQRETDRMTQMVEELLELSRIESGAAPMSFAQLDVARLVQATVGRFAQQAERAHVGIVADVPAHPVLIIGDEERLERALGNLVANAIKFTDPGGTVTIGARETDDHVEITVTDTGVGIEPEHAERVFERFYKADRGRGSGGIGLGLAIVKHIAQAHEGTVSVQSRPGRGSTFTLRLPRR